MTRNLSEICVKSELIFQRQLNGNIYCRLCLNGRKVECKYLSRIKDKNDLYQCKYDSIKKIEERHRN